MPETLERLSTLAAQYDGFILDLWGVIHDGTHLYPGAVETLKALRAAGKKAVFLSNAPRRIGKVVSVLDMLGVERGWYGGVLSSGEAACRALEEGRVPVGRRYYFIGPDRDADVLDGLPYARVHGLEQADFLLNVGFGSEEEAVEDIAPLLGEARARALPMLCLNPDMEVVKITGERYPCAGVIARAYEELGGSVQWYGKPYPEVYARCLDMLAPIPKSRLLAVGDGLHTDILGASRAGIESVLVTGGILQGNWEWKDGEPKPDYVMPCLRW